ncbi:MAG: hypothetical protein L6R38_007082 [Xanthoria sp. 2 TBL-2021]|nr:MAG: hypothetical protein L6R38_007082 [Xanthoria sp. 2 TBL-2021]
MRPWIFGTHHLTDRLSKAYGLRPFPRLNFTRRSPGMAVLESLTAEIRVDERALPEYDDHNEPPHEVSKYVEAPTGKGFSIHFLVPKEYKTTSDTLGVEFSIDGRLRQIYFFQKREVGSHVSMKLRSDSRTAFAKRAPCRSAPLISV